MLHTFHFDIKINERNKSNAGTKATQDCRSILLSLGFKDLQLNFIKHPLLLPFNLLKLLLFLSYYSFLIPRNSFIIVQYPLKGVNRFFRHFIALLKSKHCKLACIIHDLDCLRDDADEAAMKNEIRSLSAYDAVISHNAAMTKWLRANDYKGLVQEIGLFDYLAANTLQNIVEKASYQTIAFAGNLGRGNFLPELLKPNTGLHFNLYGLGLHKNLLQQNMLAKWCGSFSPDQVADELMGDFGLIWDGDSANDLSGLMGNYMRLNTPHKTSLYFVAGLPVITSESAAIAPFIKESNAGILVKSLSEMADKVKCLSKDEYRKMQENVLAIRTKLMAGLYLKAAISSIQTSLYAK